MYLLATGYKGGQLGARCQYSSEIFFLIWKKEFGGLGPFQNAKERERSDVIWCPPVANKFREFQYQKPMSLYAEIIKRFIGSGRRVAEITGKPSETSGRKKIDLLHPMPGHGFLTVYDHS